MSLVHAEYLKISRRKLYPLMVLVLASFMLFAAAAFILLPRFSDDIPFEIGKPEIYVLGAQQAAQTWFPVILAVVLLGGEFSTTAWATSLTREPSRVRQMGARLTTMTVASWLAFVLATLGWAVLATFAVSGQGSPTVGEWAGIVLKLGVVALPWTSLGLAAVSLFRSVGPAIAVGLVLSIGEGLIALWPPYANVSLTAAGTRLFPVELGAFGAFVPGSTISEPHALAIIAGWTLLGLFLTWWGLQRRDA